MIGGNLADPVQPSAEGGLRDLLRGAITRRLGGLRVVGPGDALADVIPVECVRALLSQKYSQDDDLDGNALGMSLFYAALYEKKGSLA
jgi:hypothetical protein